MMYITINFHIFACTDKSTLARMRINIKHRKKKTDKVSMMKKTLMEKPRNCQPKTETNIDTAPELYRQNQNKMNQYLNKKNEQNNNNE